MNALRLITPVLLALCGGQAGVVTAQDNPPAEAAKVLYYPEAANGPAAMRTALATASALDRPAVIVFGADWCHDSRALAKVLTSDAFKAEFADRFAVTFIDVGKPQTGEGRNLELVKQLGVKNLKSTPALFVISPLGKLLNSKKDAVSWRNAESRGADKVLAWFRRFDQH